MSKAITAADFDTEVLQSTEPVLVDFWAVWCGPCKLIGPHIDALATEYAGKAKVFKCNVEEEQDIASKYNVMQIPTLLFFKDGKVVDQLIGAESKAKIAARLDALV